MPNGADKIVTGTDIIYLAGLQPNQSNGRVTACNLATENCRLPEDECPPVNEARCSNELLEHLDHLHETNDLFGNLAKSQNLMETNLFTTAPRDIGFQGTD
jgi:hypothetical protein